jgi:hypothetical protein
MTTKRNLAYLLGTSHDSSEELKSTDLRRRQVELLVINELPHEVFFGAEQ